jgi:hypothetical protein
VDSFVSFYLGLNFRSSPSSQRLEGETFHWRPRTLDQMIHLIQRLKAGLLY